MPKSIRLVSRDVEFRAAEAMDNENTDGRTLEGYAAVFDQPTTINSWEGKFTETMTRGAFAKTLRERTPIIQYDHGHDVRVGSTPIAAIQELREDEDGLFVQARLYDNPVVEPVRQAIEGKSIRGMSFRFQVVRDEWRDNAEKLVRGDELGDLLYNPGDRGPLKRTIKEVKLFELGPVAFPAYESTSVGVRAALGELDEDDRKRLLDELVEEAKVTSAEPEPERDADATAADAIASLIGAGYTHEEIEEMVRALDSDNAPQGGQKPGGTKDPSGKKKDDNAYHVVPDHGCGEDKFAVVGPDNKNESCHSDEAKAREHATELNTKHAPKGAKVTEKKSSDPKTEEKPKPKAKDDGDKKKPYGDVQYADPKNNKYPIDTADHCKAAWSYINMPKNAAKYEAGELAAIKGRIKAAAKKFGIEISDSDKKTPEKKTPEKKSLAPTTTVTPERKAAKRAPSAASSRKESTMENEQMTVEERVARQEAIRARLSEIDTEYNGAALPEEIQTEWDDLNEEHDVHDVAIEAANRRAEQLHRLAMDERTTERAGERRRPTAQGPRRRPDNIYDVNEVRNQARSHDEVATLYRENAMRAVEQAKFGSRVRKEDAQENVERLLNNVDDEQGSLARRILVTGSPTYERAWSKAARALNTNGLTAEEQRALSLGSDPAGGYAVPFQLDPTVILDSDGVINPLRSMARVVQITGKKWQGVTTEGVVVTRSPEAAQVGENSPTFAQPEVDASRVTGFIPFSVELEASWGAMRSELTTILADAKATEEANAFINGNGQTVNPFGVVATLDAASHVADGGTFGSADIYELEEALPPRYRARGQFLGNKSTYNAVRQFATGSDGSDLWVRLGDGRPNQLIGYNAQEASEMGSVGSEDGYLLFGDFQHFLIVDRIGMSVELVPHLFGANQRPTGQRGVLAIWANGSDILVHNAFRLLKNAAS